MMTLKLEMPLERESPSCHSAVRIWVELSPAHFVALITKVLAEPRCPLGGVLGQLCGSGSPT